jgi:transcriptional regulator with XRE-family HTH domain
MSSVKLAADNTTVDTGIANRIREARETLGWTQADLAHRLGVTEDTIRGWEAAEREPRSNRLVTMAGVLGVSAHWLLDGSAQFAPAEDAAPADAARAQLESVRMKINEMQMLLNDLEQQLNQID